MTMKIVIITGSPHKKGTSALHSAKRGAKMLEIDTIQGKVRIA